MIVETGKGHGKHGKHGGGVNCFPKKQGHMGKGRGRDTGARDSKCKHCSLIKGMPIR